MTKPLEKYGSVVPHKDASLPAFHKLVETRWKTLNQASSSRGTSEESSPLQLELLALMGTYKDLHYSEVCPLKRGPQVRSAYCLHVLNHVLKANSRVLAHNAQLRDQKAQAGLEDEARDQGLTRPKVDALQSQLLILLFSLSLTMTVPPRGQVLILVPFRGGALRVVQTLISLLESKGKKVVVNNKKRFKDEFGEDGDDEPANLQRPDDYRAVFCGNVDDHFRIGGGQRTGERRGSVCFALRSPG